MIDVLSWRTPNGHEVHIMLEECGLPYRAIPVDMARRSTSAAGDQAEAASASCSTRFAIGKTL